MPLVAIGAERLDELADLLGDWPPAVSLGGEYVARRKGDKIVIAQQPQSSGVPATEVSLPCPGQVSVGDGRTVSCQIDPFDMDCFSAHCKTPETGVELLDADRVRGALTCRPRREGDRFYPLGSPGSQSVSDFLTNSKIPTSQRLQVRCICDEFGIVYVAPLRIDNRFRVTAATNRVLRIAIGGME